MLTQSELDKACAGANGLRLWEPTDEPVKRCLYLAPDVRAAIHTFVASAPSKRAAELVDDLDQYAAGRLLVIADKGNIKRLTKPIRDDWNLRSRKEPQFRLIGCFARPDHFVALYGAPRDSFSKGWIKERQEARDAWASYFGAKTWVSGTLVGHYISENTDPDASKPVP